MDQILSHFLLQETNRADLFHIQELDMKGIASYGYDTSASRVFLCNRTHPYVVALWSKIQIFYGLSLPVDLQMGEIN